MLRGIAVIAVVLLGTIFYSFIDDQLGKSDSLRYNQENCIQVARNLLEYNEKSI